MKTITTVREYDDAGRLVKETHVTLDHGVEVTDVEHRHGASFDQPPGSICPCNPARGGSGICSCVLGAHAINC